MLRFERLLGSQLEYLGLPQAVDVFDSLEYFVLVEVPEADIYHNDQWTVLAIGRVLRNPRVVSLRQLLIESEALEWCNSARQPFDGWTCSTGLHSFTPAGLTAFRDLLVSLAGQITELASQLKPHVSFLLGSVASYAECGIPEALLGRFSGDLGETQIYIYDPDENVTPRPHCGFVRISQWTTAHYLSSTLSVGFEQFSPPRVAAIQQDWAAYLQSKAVQPWLDADIMNGESTVPFSREGLLDFVELLDARLAYWSGHPGA